MQNYWKLLPTVEQKLGVNSFAECCTVLQYIFKNHQKCLLIFLVMFYTEGYLFCKCYLFFQKWTCKSLYFLKILLNKKCSSLQPLWLKIKWEFLDKFYPLLGCCENCTLKVSSFHLFSLQSNVQIGKLSSESIFKIAWCKKCRQTSHCMNLPIYNCSLCKFLQSVCQIGKLTFEQAVAMGSKNGA